MTHIFSFFQANITWILNNIHCQVVRWECRQCTVWSPARTGGRGRVLTLSVLPLYSLCDSAVCTHSPLSSASTFLPGHCETGSSSHLTPLTSPVLATVKVCSTPAGLTHTYKYRQLPLSIIIVKIGRKKSKISMTKFGWIFPP